MPVGSAARAAVLVCTVLVSASCGSGRSFGDVAWVGETEGFRAEGPAVADSADELERLLTHGHGVALGDDLEIDFERHHVVIVPAVELDGCAQAAVVDVSANERIVHISVGHERAGDQDGCIASVHEFGLVLTLDRDRWRDPPEIRVDYEVAPGRVR